VDVPDSGSCCRAALPRRVLGCGLSSVAYPGRTSHPHFPYARSFSFSFSPLVVYSSSTLCLRLPYPPSLFFTSCPPFSSLTPVPFFSLPPISYNPLLCSSSRRPHRSTHPHFQLPPLPPPPAVISSGTYRLPKSLTSLISSPLTSLTVVPHPPYERLYGSSLRAPSAHGVLISGR